MELVAITAGGSLARPIEDLPDIAREIVSTTGQIYQVAGHRPPWLGYLGVEGDECVGTCAFKGAPTNGRVEIAYFTFPGHEGRGVASRMAEGLIDLARRAMPEVLVFAQTLPEENASTRILEKLGFQKKAVIDHPEDGTVWEWELMEGA